MTYKTCENCTHYEVCLFWTAIDVKRMFSKGGCGYFKDKSEIIELPCKVGDTVYDIADGTPYKTRVVQFTVFADRISCKTVSSFPDVSEFGKRIFLTREEAEKALKELKNDEF